jgi:hypothetical protein
MDGLDRNVLALKINLDRLSGEIAVPKFLFGSIGSIIIMGL